MVKNQHKFLCIVLCLTLIVSAMMIGSFSAFASSGDKVYVKANNGWSNLHCYMWSDGMGDNASWPGVSMTKESGDVYSYTLTNNFSKIIFNNGNSGVGTNQTADLDYPGQDGMIYDLSAGSWSAYSGSDNPSPATTPATNPNTPVTTDNTVYLKNSQSWGTPKCYMWTDGAGSNTSWPGASMKDEGDGVWSYTPSQQYKMCIFNGGGDDTKTADMQAKYGYIYDNQSGQWAVYDTKPLTVKSLTADPSDGVYTGVEVSISANAASKEGTVSYKFSVANSSGASSVISDYSSLSTVSWTPVSAGTYKITCDVKDTAGNENTRSISLTVENDANLVKPVIKSVTPANLNFVKRNSAATVSVNAGGGKTGTNLLFYKYIVTDPNGAKNTPYYTLNSTYSFTPSMNGKYTVEVFVQGSDNSTTSRTYTYTAADNAPEPTVQPTSPATTPVVQPTTSSQSSTGILGDVNFDGVLDIKDATYIQKFLAAYEGYNVTVAVGDVSGDGRITINDATEIQVIISR